MADIDPTQIDDDAFDAYIVSHGFDQIKRVRTMEGFLIRAAKRFHAIDKEFAVAIERDEAFPGVKQKVWEFLSENFCSSFSDLRMWFSETDDYYSQPKDERKRLVALADILVESGRDPRKIEQAQQLCRQGVGEVVADEANMILIVVHPGSLCGSADFNLSKQRARDTREVLCSEIRGWKGNLLVLDGELSDELSQYPRFAKEIEDAVERCKQTGFGERIEADDPDHDKLAVAWLQSAGVPTDMEICLTGAWHGQDGGCVTSTYEALIAAGFSNTKVLDSAASLDLADDIANTGISAKVRAPRPR